jgi:hypothetical protein
MAMPFAILNGIIEKEKINTPNETPADLPAPLIVESLAHRNRK